MSKELEARKECSKGIGWALKEGSAKESKSQ